MGKDFTARLVGDGERVDDWCRVFGSKTINIRSPLPLLANVLDCADVLIYDLDLDLLSDVQRQRLVCHLSDRFGVPESEVEEGLGVHGCPILAEDVVVVVHNPQIWFG